jgi:hypothetical protein
MDGNMNRLCAWTLILVAVFATQGCKSLDFAGKKKAETLTATESKVEAEVAVPTKVVILWQEAVLTQPGVGRIRGFGGRIYFHDRMDKPIAVDGTLSVYGFDDSNPVAKNRQPDKKFVFESEHLAAKQDVTPLGVSYNIWLPWDEDGGYRKLITLVPVFRSANGEVINGESMKNTLPGPTSPEDKDTAEFIRRLQNSQPGVIDKVNYEESERNSKMRATTIEINDSMNERLQLPQAQNNLPAANEEELKALAAAEEKRIQDIANQRVQTVITNKTSNLASQGVTSENGSFLETGEIQRGNRLSVFGRSANTRESNSRAPITPIGSER